jgi:hypothetical protein
MTSPFPLLLPTLSGIHKLPSLARINPTYPCRKQSRCTGKKVEMACIRVDFEESRTARIVDGIETIQVIVRAESQPGRGAACKASTSPRERERQRYRLQVSTGWNEVEQGSSHLRQDRRKCRRELASGRSEIR